MALPSISAWHLVERAQAGDVNAFAALYKIYSPNIHKALYRRCGDWHLAEDLCSETFRRALAALPTVKDQGKDVGGWFGIIAKNLLRDNRELARNREEKAVPPDELPVTVVPEGALAAVLVNERAEEMRDVLALAMEELTTQQRDVLTHRYWMDRTPAETAIAIHTTVGTVRVATSKALKRMASIPSLQSLMPPDKDTDD